MSTHVRRKLTVIPVAYSASKEIEIPADSVLYDLAGHGSDETSINFVLAVPDGAAMVKRTVWMCKLGDEVPASAQEGSSVFLGMVFLPGISANVLIFVESQAEALIRSQHRRRY